VVLVNQGCAVMDDVITGNAVSRAYDAQALRYLLAVERTRAHRANRALVVVLVTPQRQADSGSQFERALGERILAALSASVREVDFVGWFRQDRVVAAVLAQSTDAPDRAAVDRILARMRRRLDDGAAVPISGRLRVRVVHLAPSPVVAGS
jgi:hypothetical protein